MKVQLTKEKSVSNYSRPFIIAEIGANHNGDIDLAKKIILAAKKCGADAIKFQSWTPQSLISNEEYEKNQTYNDSNKKHFGSLKEMVEKYYLTTEQHIELSSYCKEIGVGFCSTPFSIEEADLLDSLDVPFFKIASMDINNLELLKYVSKFNKPIILSTGMSTLGEIENAIRTIESTGNNNIVLLHCISIYPPKNEDIHLRNISMLQQAFGYPVGFSDHSIGISVPIASIALGACIIEKHFTLNKDMPGWDHEISADPIELEELIKEGRIVNGALGNFRRTVSNAEQEKKDKFRRSIVSINKLSEGHVLEMSDFAYKRPGTGIAPDEAKFVVGRTLSRDIQPDELIRWVDIK